MIDGDNAEFLTKYGLFEDRQVFFTLVAAGKEDRAGFDTLANWAKSKGDDIFDLDLPRLVSEVLYLIEDHPVFERVAAIATLIEIYSEIETNLVDRYDYLTDGKAHCFHVHPEFDFFPDKYPLDRWGLSVPDPIYCLRRFNDYLKICQEDKLLNSEVEDHFEILGRNGHVQGLFTAYSPWEWESKLTYASLVVLRDRYLLRGKDRRIYETPSIMFLRVATQLGFSQVDLTDNVAEVFNIFETLSELRFMPSTPTLFNSGLRQPQLSSCYLTTIEDSIEGIYEGYLENAQLSKYAGGLGNDWTPVRASGAYIAGTNGESQGIVPFLKIANDSAVAVNQSGKRRGAVCAYLEVWHLDIMDFTELRKNDGASELRRTPQMHTAVWIPDLFMERVHEEGDWTLFSPDEPLTKDLHDLYGHDFKAAYLAAEKATKRGDGSVKLYKKIKAVDLWRQILTMLYSTGHPWVCFKDSANMRSPLSHVGVVHSSNLCVEITLPTSDNEIAVCNLGSVNLAAHVNDDDGLLDTASLERTVRTAVRMLDRVIDVNHYPVNKACESNMRNRPIGLGIMGFQDILYKYRIPFDSDEAVKLADTIQEEISYNAISESADLVETRCGAFPSFYTGSSYNNYWSYGMTPLDTFREFEEYRQDIGYPIPVDTSVAHTDKNSWARLGNKIKVKDSDGAFNGSPGGIRNSNLTAIAPTATIATICGVTSSIEPCFANISTRSNLSGDFAIPNKYLVRELLELGLWNEDIIEKIKAEQGSIQNITEIPDETKRLFKTVFEIDQKWLIRCAAARQKWIDQSQSLNLYVDEPTGKELDELYKYAWRCGLKTTYYLRSKAKRSAEALSVQSSQEFDENLPAER